MSKRKKKMTGYKKSLLIWFLLLLIASEACLIYVSTTLKMYEKGNIEGYMTSLIKDMKTASKAGNINKYLSYNKVESKYEKNSSFEEGYKELFNDGKDIMISEYPEYNKILDFKENEEKIEQIKEIITGIRNIRTKMNVHPTRKSKLIFVTKKDYVESIKQADLFIKKLGFADSIVIQENKEKISPNAINVISADLEVFMPFEDLVDLKAEIERLEKEKSKILVEKEKADNMLKNAGFLQKAPKEKVEEMKIKQIKLNDSLKSIEDRIKQINH